MKQEGQKMGQQTLDKQSWPRIQTENDLDLSNKADENNAHGDDDDDEEEVKEDKVDLFVLFSSCRHLPVGHFFAISSSLSLPPNWASR